MEILENSLEKHIVRKNDLLKTLYEKKGYVTTKELCSICSIDRRTVYQEMKEVKNCISEYFRDKKIVESHKIYGYRFSGSKKDFKKIRMHLFENSAVYCLLREMLMNKEVRIQKFCSENFISVSVLEKGIVALRTCLKKFEFNLKKRKGYIALTGDETRIRYFMFSLCWHVYGGVCWPFSNISRDKVERYTCKELFIESKNKMQNEKWMFILAINVNRYNKKCLLKRKCLPAFCKVTNRHYENINFKIAAIFRRFYIDNSVEKDFFLLWLQTDVNFYSHEIACKKTYEIHQKLDTQIYKKTQLLIGKLQEEIDNLNAVDKKIFFATLIANATKAELFHEMEHNIVGFTTQHFKSAISYINNLVSNSASSKKSDMESLLKEFSEALILLRNLRNFRPEIKVYIETEFPPALEKSTINRIESFFGMNFNLSIDTDRKKQIYDICISSWENESIAENHVLVGNWLTIEELIEIEKLLSKIEDKKMKDTTLCA